MKMRKKDLLKVKNILGRWGELTPISQEKSRTNTEGYYVFVTTAIEGACVDELIENGFRVSIYGNMIQTGWIEVYIKKRR